MKILIKYIMFILTICVYVYFYLKRKRTGYLKSFLNILNITLSIILTKMMTGSIIVLMKDYTNIQSTVSSFLYKIFFDTTFLSDILINQDKIFSAKDMDSTVRLYIEKTLSDYVLNVFFAIIVFLIFFIIIKIIFKMMDLENMITYPTNFDKKIGSIFGLIEASCIIWAIFLLFRAVEIIPVLKNEINNLISFPIVKVLYEKNFFYKILNNVLY